jgi:hypothetical protein
MDASYGNVKRSCMRESDYREIEAAVASALRVFLESKQKLNSFERACHESFTTLLADVVKRRMSVGERSSSCRS